MDKKQQKALEESYRAMKDLQTRIYDGEHLLRFISEANCDLFMLSLTRADRREEISREFPIELPVEVVKIRLVPLIKNLIDETKSQLKYMEPPVLGV